MDNARRLLEERERESRRDETRLTGRVEREDERLDLVDLRGMKENEVFCCTRRWQGGWLISITRRWGNDNWEIRKIGY
jgi:hypothetical protein